MARVPVTIRTAAEQKAAWEAAAERDGRTLSGWMRHTLDAAAAGPVYDTPESVERKLQQAVEVRESFRQAVAGVAEEGAAEGETAPAPPPPEPPPAAEGVREGEPPPAAVAPPPREFKGPDPRTRDVRATRTKTKSIEDVLGHGTVSQAQSVKAIEAQRRQAEQQDLFSITCPQRNEHQPGTRCPTCKGIR